MKLEDTKINAKELWNIMSIREETPDEYGREGRGIDLIYFNKEYENTEFIPYDNVKIAFENWKELNQLKNELEYCHKNRQEEIIEYLERKHNAKWSEINFEFIFGWEEE